MAYKALLNKQDDGYYSSEYYTSTNEVPRAPRELCLAERAAAQTEGILQGRIDELEKDNRTLSNLIDLLVVAKRDGETSIKKLQENECLLQHHIRDSREAAEATINMLKERNSDLAMENSNLVKSNDAEIRKHVEQYNSLGARAHVEVEARDAKISKLEENNATLEREKDVLDGRIRDACNDTKEAMASRDADVSKLQEENSVLCSEITGLRKKAAEVEEVNKAETTKLEQEKDELRHQLFAVTKELEAAKKANEIASAPKTLPSPISPFTPASSVQTEPSPSLFPNLEHSQLGSYPIPPASSAWDKPVYHGLFGEKASPLSPNLADPNGPYLGVPGYPSPHVPPPSFNGGASTEQVQESRAVSNNPQTIPEASYTSGAEDMDENDRMSDAGESEDFENESEGDSMGEDEDEPMGEDDSPPASNSVGSIGGHPVTRDEVTKEESDGINKEPRSAMKSSGASNPRASRHNARKSTNRTRANGGVNKPASFDTARPRRFDGKRPAQRSGKQPAETRGDNGRQKQPKTSRNGRFRNGSSRSDKQPKRNGVGKPQSGMPRHEKYPALPAANSPAGQANRKAMLECIGKANGSYDGARREEERKCIEKEGRRLGRS